MTNDLTINTRSFVMNYSDKTGSKRTCISRGATLPDVLMIRHQDYVDSATKLPGKRTMVKIERYIEGQDGVIKPVSFHLVGARPNDSAVTVEELEAALADLVALFTAVADGGLDLGANIFGSLEQ